MNNKIPTQIVDKNGKPTTVHRNPVTTSGAPQRVVSAYPRLLPGFGNRQVRTIFETRDGISPEWLDQHRVTDSEHNREWFASEGEINPSGYITACYDEGVFFVNAADEYVFAPLVAGHDIAAVSVSPVVQPTDTGYTIAYNADITDDPDHDSSELADDYPDVVVFSTDLEGNQIGIAHLVRFEKAGESSDYLTSLASNPVEDFEPERP